MKKFLFLLIAIASSVAATAQIEKGTIFIGATSNLSFTSTSIDGVDDKLNTYNIEGKAGYFVTENLTIGVTLGYEKIKFSDFIDESATSVGLFGRYYVNGKIFLGAGFQSYKVEGGDSETLIPLEIGYAAFITDNITVEPSLNYVVADGGSTLGIGVGFGLYLNRGGN